MRYIVIVLLMLSFFTRKALDVLANPVPTPVIITEFSTDKDWIEIANWDGWQYDFYVCGAHVYVFNIEPGEYIVLDQTNTSGFDLPDGYGSIEFGYSPELRYGRWGPVPAPPKHESAESNTEWTSDYTDCFRLTPFLSKSKPNSFLNSAAYGSSNVVINEIFFDDAQSEQSFIELYNTGDIPIDISHWSIVNLSRYYIPQGTIIEPGGYWVLEGTLFPAGFTSSNTFYQGVIYLQDDSLVMREMVGWAEKGHDEYSLIRYPDGFCTNYQSYDTTTAVDFRESLPTPGSSNQEVFPIKTITVEEDSTVIYPGNSYQFYVRAVDENNDTFRVQPEEWFFNGDFASINQTGLMTAYNYGKGIIEVAYKGFSASVTVFGVLAGRLEQDIILTAENGPYWINLSIPDDVTLTITPGTVLKYKGYNNAIYCDGGRLSAIGTIENPIWFVSTNDTSHMTKGVQLSGGSSECIFDNCVFDNFYRAIELSYSNRKMIVSNCTFRNNTLSVFTNSGGSADISNCIISGDVDTDVGIDMNWAHSDGVVRNNMFLNLKKAMYLEEGSFTNVVNNMIYNCTIGIDIDQWHDGMHICNNNIWNTDTPFYGDTATLGVISTQNRNGIPCDAYFNISADPLFVDPDNGDFRLLAGSPCIDAGDPSITDSDGSVSDIGYLSGVPPVGIMATNDAPAALQLRQNSPNPFNASTIIPFTLPESWHVTLEVYSITGQKVATLVDDYLPAGSHHTVFDGSGLSSGIYITRLFAGGTAQTGKMLMVK